MTFFVDYYRHGRWGIWFNSMSGPPVDTRHDLLLLLQRAHTLADRAGTNVSLSDLGIECARIAKQNLMAENAAATKALMRRRVGS